MAAIPPPAPTMRKMKGIIALDLDGTLLNSNKELTPGNLAALEKAAAAGYAIVPTTGRFYGGMPQVIRELPFVRYAITINGAEVADLSTGQVIYKAEIPREQAVEIMRFLDGFPLIYDCFQANAAYMTAAQKAHIEIMASSPHYQKMLHELRQSVPELKAFLAERDMDVQKIQFFTNQPQLRLALMERLPHVFSDILVSSSVVDNVEINEKSAHKGAALLALARHLGIPRENTLAFGDGLNDLTMLRDAGIGIAMANACDEAKKIADHITLSCDADGVAHAIEQYCFQN